ncbi:MAG TPA: prepilin-type N-terminal cleavage/methylation domain-containing protein [Planctomycetes bacterium]|nr:prepilin-type N-terminal cleavage/methylation domain-containing protein [Planctomycetota bacterium]
MRRREETSGFTLIELMIAITISAMVFLGIFGVIRSGINTQMFVREMSDAGRQGPAILQQITADLHNAAFYNFKDNLFFVGKPLEVGGDNRADQLHFITHRGSLVADPAISDQEDVLAPIAEVSWMLRKGREGFLELVRREQPYVDDHPFSGGYLRLISDRVISFRVQYTGWNLGYGEDEEENASTNGEGNGEDSEEDDTLVWEDEWDSSKKGCLPSAIKIELVISPDVDPDVMKRMRRDNRIANLDRSYFDIVLLPQFREDVITVRETADWDGDHPIPTNQGTVGANAARGRGRGNGPQSGTAGGARGQGTGNQGRGNQPGNNAGANFLNQLRGSGRNTGSNPFLNQLQGGNRRR